MTDFELDSGFEERLSAAVREQVIVPWAKTITASAKRYAPVLTGALRESINYEIVSDTEAIIGSDLDYAAAQELGTSKMAAQPYLRPALYEGLA